MEKFIRKLLNYDFDSLSYIQRLKFCKEYLRLCEQQIPIHTPYTAPKFHFIMNEFSNEEYLGSSNNNILANNTLFVSNHNKNIVESLSGLGHESCHGGQQNSISFNTNAKDITNTIAVDPTYFKIVYDFYEKYYVFPMLAKGKTYKELALDPKIDKFLQSIEKYLKGFYYLHPLELEAENFGVQMVDDIISFSQTLDLSNEEQQRLEEIAEGLENEKQRQQSVKEEFENSRDDIIARKCIQHFASEMLSNFSSTPSLVTEFENLEEADFTSKSRNSSWKPILIMRLLELNYNDKLAHSLLNALLINKNKGRHLNAFIYNFVGSTDIQLTPAEEEKFKKVLEESTVYSLDYPTFLQEKERHRAFINEYTKKTPSFNSSNNSGLNYYTFK